MRHLHGPLRQPKQPPTEPVSGLLAWGVVGRTRLIGLDGGYVKWPSISRELFPVSELGTSCRVVLPSLRFQTISFLSVLAFVNPMTLSPIIRSILGSRLQSCQPKLQDGMHLCSAVPSRGESGWTGLCNITPNLGVSIGPSTTI